jgi:hypothetical protein
MAGYPASFATENIMCIHCKVKQRDVLLGRATIMRKEITQIFDDTDHWNSTHPNEEPINPDPDGSLQRLAAGIDKMLAG